MEKLTLKVPGMSCDRCVASVSAALEQVPGVSVVEVELDHARVEVAGEDLELDSLTAAVREAGYEPDPSSP